MRFVIHLCAAVAVLLSAKLAAAIDGELKPHFLYMHRLREYLSDSRVATLDSLDSVQGQLVATSIETLQSGGRGHSVDGFSFEATNQIELEFTIPKQSTVACPDVELWIFPDRSQTPRNRIMEIYYLARARIPQVSSSRSHQFSVLWNTSEDCVHLNLTGLSKKISRILQRRNLNESDVSVEVEIVRMIHRNIQMESGIIEALKRDLCSSLAQRETNSSFLIIKNYDESKTQHVFTKYNLPPPPSKAVQKRNIAEILTVSTSGSCSTVPFVVNLTAVYGDFIKGPIVTDIRDCSGRCTLLHDGKRFSKHGEIKEMLKLLPGGDFLSTYEPTCTPVQFRPLHILIELQDKSDAIVQLSDLLVDKCVCQ